MREEDVHMNVRILVLIYKPHNLKVGVERNLSVHVCAE
jgi:hypothetical protein